MAQDAFDLAEQLQTPVFVMSDLDLGMNNWMSEPFAYPEKPLNRGKVLSAEDLTRLGGFARYKDVDGDGVGYRTLPGTDHPLAAYFTRGSGHNEKAQYTERPDDYSDNMERLHGSSRLRARWFRGRVSCRRARRRSDSLRLAPPTLRCVESRDQIEEGVCESILDYLRLRAYPFRARCTTLWRRMSAFMWSSRIAMRRC